jgi:DNA topoisomerase-1
VATGQDFSAKDFRTWGGTVSAARGLNAVGPAGSESEGKRAVVQTVKSVARLLGNRPATCRNYYIHPAIPEFYLRGELFAFFERQQATAGSGEPGALGVEERAVMEILREDLRRSTGLAADKLAETA